MEFIIITYTDVMKVDGGLFRKIFMEFIEFPLKKYSYFATTSQAAHSAGGVISHYRTASMYGLAQFTQTTPLINNNH